MLLGALTANILGNALARKRLIRSGEAGEGVIRAGQNF